MNDAYLTNLRGRAERYGQGKERVVTSTVAAVANLQQQERTTIVKLQELEQELWLEGQRRLVAEKALLESEQERQMLERMLKESAAPKVVPAPVGDDEV